VSRTYTFPQVSNSVLISDLFYALLTVCLEAMYAVYGVVDAVWFALFPSYDE